MQIIRSIQNRIYEVRGERIMLDFDLAALYEVETRILNQSVKRNSKRFPEDFIFRLSGVEWKEIQSQVYVSAQFDMSSQFVMTYPKKRQMQLYHTPSQNKALLCLVAF
jgi:hypothetical protein